MKAISQEWMEWEQGWGARTAGRSLHENLEDHKKYVEAFRLNYDPVLEDIIAPSGNPREEEVSEEVWEKIVGKKAKNPQEGLNLGLWIED